LLLYLQFYLHKRTELDQERWGRQYDKNEPDIHLDYWVFDGKSYKKVISNIFLPIVKWSGKDT
jgi:hypothetical protein